jgi:integrase/recombinase XerD
MRIHEALGLTWDEIYNNGGDWYVQILGKGHKTRHNKIPLSLYEKLQALETSNYIFLSNRKRPLSAVMAHKAIKGAASRAGIARSVSCHTLRHSHASHEKSNLMMLMPTIIVGLLIATKET